jgi:ADP-ribose pyrophosphatase YjhB (NUDIX family)
VRFEYCASCGSALGLDAPCSCPACGAEFWANAKPCAGALVVREGRLLLVRRTIEPWNGRWDIPGGFSEEREHPEETARRELREETGLEIVVDDLLGIWLDRYGAQEPPEVTLNIYYLAHLVRPDAEPSTSGEVSEVAWFAPDALPAPVAFPDHATEVLDRWRATMRRIGTDEPPRSVAVR